MNTSRRLVVMGIVAAAASGLACREALSQQGITDGQPTSTVTATNGYDGWQSQGGVVGPWWTGSSTAATPPVGSGGFWFGFPGLGFGGSQGSTSGMGTVAPSVTTTNGANGFVSSSRLTPFVTGVVPVVGDGFPLMTATTAPVLSLPVTAFPSVSSLRAVPMPAVSIAPAHAPASGPSTPEARDRAKELVAAGDRRLLDATEGPAAAKASLADYRSAARFARDDADIEIRQAILYEALGKRRDADRAIERAARIDRRLAGTINVVPADAAGFLASPPPGMPVVAVRGFAILRDAQEPAEPSPDARPASPVIHWLSEAWARRWGPSAASAMLPTP